jgi:hypothetical protein
MAVTLDCFVFSKPIRPKISDQGLFENSSTHSPLPSAHCALSLCTVCKTALTRFLPFSLFFLFVLFARVTPLNSEKARLSL